MKKLGPWPLFALACTALACGPRQVGSGAHGGENGNENSAHEPQLKKVLAVDWALEDVPPVATEDGKTKISLALTNEVGATTIEYLGEFRGSCTEPGAGPGSRSDQGALLWLRCTHSGGGTILQVRRHGAALILLRAPMQTGPGGLSFEEAGRVTIPGDTAVRAKE